MNKKITIKEKFICIDWLQISLKRYNCEPKHSGWKKTEMQTRIFCEIWEFYNYDELFCTIAVKPKSKILPQDMVLLKIDNKQLYTNTWHGVLKDLIKYEGWLYNNISRLDLAMDFQYFDNEIEPQTLCERFFQNYYLKNGKSEFKSIGNQTNKINYEYLRFGNATSSVSAYMYNKSKEMRDVKIKAHILKLHEDLKFDLDKDVWRLEFSIKEFKNQLVDNMTGNIVEINFSDLYNQKILFDIYKALYNKYFDFRKNDKKKNKSRMEKIILFKFENCVYRWFSNVDKLDAKRADKIFINKIESYNNELRAIKKDSKLDLESLVTEVIEKKNLQKWYEKKKDKKMCLNDLQNKSKNYSKLEKQSFQYQLDKNILNKKQIILGKSKL